MKSFRTGVASVQAVHWVCQPDASSQGIQKHAEPFTCEVMWTAMSCQRSWMQEVEASGCRRRQSSSPRIGCWSLARQTKPFDGAWDRVKVDQMDLDEHRNSWPSWRQSRTGEELTTDDGTRSGCRRLRRLKKQGARPEVSTSRNGTTTHGESRSGPRVDCWMQQGRQHEDE